MSRHEHLCCLNIFDTFGWATNVKNVNSFAPTIFIISCVRTSLELQ